jgi:N-methylhydantoinase B
MAPAGKQLLDPDEASERKIHSKGTYDVPAGTVLSTRLSGSGGYGDPLERDPELVARDVRHGLVSPQFALEVYGVVSRAT